MTIIEKTDNIDKNTDKKLYSIFYIYIADNINNINNTIFFQFNKKIISINYLFIFSNNNIVNIFCFINIKNLY